MEYLTDSKAMIPMGIATAAGLGGAYYLWGGKKTKGYAYPRDFYPEVKFNKHETAVQVFYKQCNKRAEEVAYAYKKLTSEEEEEEEWTRVNFKEYAAQSKTAARSFQVLKKDQKKYTISLWGDNLPEYHVSWFGGITARAIVSGIYSTTSAKQLIHLLNHSDTDILFIEKRENYEKLLKVYKELKTLKTVVLYNEYLAKSIDSNKMKDANIETMSFQAFMNLGKDNKIALPEQKEYDIDDVAIYIYSSGTTGPPKCVMLTHRNLVYMGKTLDNMTLGHPHWMGKSDTQHIQISYLPPCHIAEILMSMILVAYNGVQTYFLRNRKELLETLKQVRPTIFMSVPRGWAKIQTGINKKFKEATGIKKSILSWARSVALHYHTQQNKKNGVVSNSDEYQLALARKLVFSKIKEAIGLDRAIGFISGAAPLSKDSSDFFQSIDIVIHEVYGQSEGTGIASANHFRAVKNGTVGWPLPGLEVKIGEDDEILVKGPSVFKGYYKDEQLTKETLDSDGFLHSGDKGRFDADGFLKIIGRKKDIIVTAGGKNITPSNIEQEIKQTHDLIGDVVLVGDQRKFISAIVSLDRDEMIKTYGSEDKADEHYQSDEIRKEIQKGIDEVNEGLNQVEKVKKFVVASRSFSIEGGELTPTAKVKRNIVYKNFEKEIDSMYH